MDEFAGLTKIVFRVRVEGVAGRGWEGGNDDVPPPPHPERASTTIPTTITTLGWILTRFLIPPIPFLLVQARARRLCLPGRYVSPRHPAFLYRVTAFRPRCMAE
jgi:hypothetical protein